jgi:preprotein translocase subunit SecE
VLDKTKNFLNDVRGELHRVTWPSRKETMSTTWVVVFIIVLISSYLGLCDFFIAKLMNALIR